MNLNLPMPRHLNSSLLPVGVGLAGLGAAAAFVYWLERERRAARAEERRQADSAAGATKPRADLQEQPESTIGHRPAELHGPGGKSPTTK